MPENDVKMVEGWGKEKLFQMIMAADTLDCEQFVDLLATTLACRLFDKDPEDIRKEFEIINDFSPEEESSLREQNASNFVRSFCAFRPTYPLPLSPHNLCTAGMGVRQRAPGKCDRCSGRWQ